jgi:hypothetical protein
MISEGYITANWAPRRESLNECEERLRSCLQELERLNSLFTAWLNVRCRKGKQTVTPEPAVLRELLLSGRNKTEVSPRRVMEELGFSVALMTDNKLRERLGFRVNCGGYHPSLLNRCFMDFAEQGNLSYGAVSGNEKLAILKSFISSWNPEWGAITTRPLLAAVKSLLGISVRVNFGWVTYIDDRCGELPPEVHGSYLVEAFRSGRLIHVTENEFDEENEDQISAAARLYRMLDHAGMFYKVSQQINSNRSNKPN